MKICPKKKLRVVGDWIVRVHDVENPRRAPFVIHLAVHGQTVVFHPPPRFTAL